jgi:hypothetical protein
LSFGRWLRRLYLLYFSQPAGERALYRYLLSRPLRSVVELGMKLNGRTARVLEIAGWSGEELRYTGIDLFDARPEGQEALKLKSAFAGLRRPGVQVQLVPGDPFSALARVSNSLMGTDVIIIGAEQDEESLSRAWTWVPRMLKPDSRVLLEETTESARTWRLMPREEILKRAEAAKGTRRRAA